MITIDPDKVAQSMGHQLSTQELMAIHHALQAGRDYGYGNIMAWLATEWAVKLRDESNIPENVAKDAVSNRRPYPLPPKPSPKATAEGDQSKPAELWRCSKRRCGWIGTDAEKHEVPIKDYLPVKATELRCPICGCNSFYRHIPKKKA